MIKSLINRCRLLGPLIFYSMRFSKTSNRRIISSEPNDDDHNLVLLQGQSAL
ncbi:Hypothetical protein PMT_2602 [Prochlorococcus marinus str. MIT 9313]|uniref:Uncharacterized protein n=1 Tax=Prochlorococcus marinus (strain MIT 9313) TaxID=74547 RepID=B9ER73_PROMM|nr:Hypothetical protein PMT_2602 [Prochlorococcus marinus str. MIT 9313]